MNWRLKLSQSATALWTTLKVMSLMAFTAQMVLSSLYFYSNYRGTLNKAASAVRQYQMNESAIKQSLAKFAFELRGLKQTGVNKIVNKYFPEKRKAHE